MENKTRSTNKAPLTGLNMSKLQPQARDLEEAVLGALMLEQTSIEKVLGKRIERRRLPGFNYGSFAPESQFQRARPQRTQSRPAHKPAWSQGNNGGSHAGAPRRRRPRQRKQYST